ncbi:tripartite tricarboxylate transporter substrate binding protein [Mesorhizobium sp. B2-1-8]|uniref:Bug family tripartite tricarboxylate transporter substrate binding protein n=1 Tax=unclassified Mesorhizobium TaxID=325217 RepID=UPI00112C3EE2|nr:MULTISPECIES: tripartite tricarboxylate transporter substrate-binding protein [unclassified Mesorhizobium]MBZ9668547.1 tripartite tricarboxylate transporter substrate binding protein [Mesorhizobium sp. ES1-3]MBZ9709706.1 tripartite tricarboxylate transporter substrate binding protein [Mesorhizobium sp. ESP7-2]TPI35178.1 tripartite tricarboxylate transporter substrate binding protein [Mesorhizobium sp. B3-2-1]UCI19007.1 tripartite tricarboxylate transporter substrate binding protein [Mesorhiz
MIRFLTKMVAGAALVAVAAGGMALAQPAKPECLAGAKPGGGFDLTCRLAANALLTTKQISQPMAVTYMEGGVGAVAYNHVIAKRAKDGNLITAASSGSALLIAQGKFGQYDENAVRWLGALGADYGVLVVNADSPYKTLKDLVDAYKADPSSFAIAGGGAVGSQDWMKASLLAKAAGQEPKQMHYAALEGGGAVLTALEGGHVQVGSGDAAEMVKHHVAGKIRILAVMAPQRLTGALADVPTAHEQGFDIDWPIWRGYYVGKDVSDADFDWWVKAFEAASKTPEFAKEREERGLFEFTMVGKPFEERVKADVVRFKQLAKEAGM